MWSHPSWENRPLAPRERLRAYASWCNAVEGNTTFYATPSADTVASWVEQTTPEFRFLLKIPKTVTHERRLVDVAPRMRAFLDAVEPLGQRVHALWVQLPPSFGPADLPALASFLRRLPRDYRRVVEVRHPAFFDDPRALEATLDGAEWVTFDTTVLFGQPPVTEAEQESWQKKPRLPRRAEALTAHPVVRYIGRDDPERTALGWRPWVDTVVTWLREGRSPTVFIHTPDNAEAPSLARRFHDDVRERLPGLASLPEPVPTQPLTLF
ncbi:DUF72 domain-containing protein [Amycolatopsis acididurans]|nr:DUF72 domain-containing protein [Amycolatopsis acididurans]